MPRLQQIEVGFGTFIEEADEAFGVVEALEPGGRAAVAILAASKGAFEVPYLAIKYVRDGAVVFDASLLPPPLRAALAG